VPLTARPIPLPRSGSSRDGPIRTDSLLGVWPFSGMRPPGVFSSPGSFPVAMLPYGNFLRLIWPLLTPCPIPRCVAMTGALPKKVQPGKVSPDKNVHYGYATATFTLSSESRALSCCADLPGDLSLGCRFCSSGLLALHSGFLRTVARGSALALTQRSAALFGRTY